VGLRDIIEPITSQNTGEVINENMATLTGCEDKLCICIYIYVEHELIWMTLFGGKTILRACDCTSFVLTII
jgi:hypothetical protein